jgi:subtilisin family serine protease
MTQEWIMHARRIALLCLAILLALPTADALAQSRGAVTRGGQDGAPGGRGGDYGGHRGGHGGHFGGWGRIVPGIIMTLPQAPAPERVIEEDDDAPVVHRTQRRQRPPQRAARRASGAPPAGETRLVPDEVVLELRNSASERQIQNLQRRFRLTQLERRRLQLSGTTFFRWRIPDRRSVPAVVRALEADRLVVSAQPNYTYALQQTPVAEGDPAQYELAKLHLPEAHRLAKGGGVRVAVIDSGIDAEHPDLAGAITESFNAIDTPAAAHAHGTAIAALIAAHGRLVGAAPDARILAVRAFDPKGGSAQGTTFAILKGIDWAADHHARIINMSFAGPPDPAVRRSLQAAHKKGIVLIAAAGNAGPKSPPLYPAADPDVIAVTATDAQDKLLSVANRGRHIAVAAPGVDLLVAIPDGGYEVSSGTSYSAAEVSGIAALLLQHKPALTPDKLRQVLLETAKDLGRSGRDDVFGAGLVDSYSALSAGAETSQAARKRR